MVFGAQAIWMAYRVRYAFFALPWRRSCWLDILGGTCRKSSAGTRVADLRL